MTRPDKRRPSAAGLVAVLAALTGVALLSVAALRLGDTIGDPASTAATSVAAVTTTGQTTASTSNPAPAATAAPGAVVTVTDDSGTIAVSVPVEWTDTSGEEWVVDDSRIGPSITAAPDIDAWYSTWGTPGAFVGVSTSGFDPEGGDFSGICSPDDRSERSFGVLAGTVQAWSDCGAEGGDFFVFVGGPLDASFAVLVQLVNIDGNGLAVMDQVLTTFSYEK
jgi:hypothetical protein